jgi:hypothetical protein
MNVRLVFDRSQAARLVGRQAGRKETKHEGYLERSIGMYGD